MAELLNLRSFREVPRRRWPGIEANTPAKMKAPAPFERGGTADPDPGGGRSRCQGREGGRRPPGVLARRSPLALEAGGEAFRGLAGRSLAHRAGYAERSAEQLLLRAQRGQPLFVRARNIGTQ